MYPEAKHVIGVAMESGVEPENFSEDLLYFDCSGWNEELERQTKEDQKRLGILVAPDRFERSSKEYPSS
ncbi:hypothetical protein WG906_04825 [Pedobacter sp. P351]|uniref:hypothetical protein n=1 Tax=Pedobacter superstes TaxID=3133441 RepID=UPI0030B1BC39